MDQSVELDNLIDLFWNYVRLGQWQLAIATSQSIKSFSRIHYQNLLLAIVLNPEKYSSGAKSLLSPFHLSWLAVRELKKNVTEDTCFPPQLEKELEFKILLFHIEAETPLRVLEDLSSYHKQIVQVELGIFLPERVEMFSSSCVDVIGNLLIKDPLYAAELVNMLTGKGTAYEINNLSLSQLFCNRISTMMMDIVNDDCCDEDRDQFFLLLSIAKKHLNAGDLTLIEHFKELTGKFLLDSSLTNLYNSLMEFENSQLASIIDSTEQDFIIKEFHFENDGEAAEILTKLLDEKSAESWLKIFLLCFHHKLHLLQCIVDGILYLVNAKEYKRVSNIVERWKPLAPLVLMLVWVNCCDFTEATAVLSCLVGDCEGVTGYFGPICRKLVYQTKLVEWCMEKTRQILGDNYDSSLLLKTLFQQLGTNSVLSVLNKTNLLKLLKNEEIVNILEEQHNIKKFPLDHLSSTTNYEVEIFLCFNIIKKFLHLIMAALKGSLIEQDGIIVPFTKALVQTYLSEIKFEIMKIGPVGLRVEVLSNIFSLLFLRTSDLKDYQKEDIDLDNIEEISLNSSMSRSLNRSLSMSLESISTIGDDHLDSRNASLDRNASLCTEISPEKIRRALFIAKNKQEHSPLAVLADDDKSQVQPEMNQVPPEGSLISAAVEALSQEIDVSSTETVKARTHSEECLRNIPPQFLVNSNIVRETLVILSHCLSEITVEQTDKSTNSANLSLGGDNLQHHLSLLKRYVDEAQWRLELITGFQRLLIDNSFNTRYDDHLISNMLSSSESLVYLTLGKGDIIQAKQVIKMFNLTDEICSKEVDLVENLAITSEKLLSVSKPTKQEKTHTSLSFIKSAASAGLISSEVNQAVETLLNHEFLLKKKADASLVDSSVCTDLMFTLPLPFNVCKTLIDLALIKIETGSNHADYTKMTRKLKDIKALLQFTTSRKLKVFQLFGHENPMNFLNLSLLVPTKLLHDTLEFEESKYVQGQTAFNNLSVHVKEIMHRYHELEEETSDSKSTEEIDLKELCTNLFAVFNNDTIAQLNHNSSAHDYLRSLFRYVNSLSSMQLYYRNRQSSDSAEKRPFTNQKAMNPFVVFNDNIADTFGQLLFQYGMAPKKLEVFAKQTGIDLLKVIAQNCGVMVSSKVKDLPVKDGLLFTEPVVLNRLDGGDSLNEIELGKSPNLTVEELLNSALDMVSDAEQPSRLTDSEVYQMLLVSTKELQKIDLNELKTTAEKMSFFINLFNLMFLHGLLLVTSHKMEHEFVLTPNEMSLILSESLGRLVFHQMIAYQVGTLGVVTAFDIYFYVFLNGMETGFFNAAADKKWRCWKRDLSIFVAEEYTPLCLHLMSHGTIDSPLIQVTYPSKVESMMATSTVEYLDDHLGVDVEKKEIFISEMALLHAPCFLQQSTTSIEKITDEDNRHKLLLSLSKLASPALRHKLQTHSKNDDFTITIEEHDWTLRYSKIPSQPVEKAMKFHVLDFLDLSPSTSSYLTTVNPLIATFIRLCVTRNKLVKNMRTVFENNLLHLSTDKENQLTVYESIRKGVEDLTKEASTYNILKNFVLESSSKVVNMVRYVSLLESSEDQTLLKSLYISIQNILKNQFLSTLSSKDFLCILPDFIRSCLHTHNCSILPLNFLDLIITLPSTMFDLICSRSIMEKKEKLVALDNGDNVSPNNQEELLLRKDVKTLLLLFTNYDMKCFYTLEFVKYLQAEDCLDVLKVCLEASERSLYKEELQTCYRQICWCNKVYTASHLHGEHDMFSNWQDVELRVKADGEYIITFLVKHKEYELLDVCFQVYQMTDDIKEQYVKTKLQSLLTDESTDYLSIQSTLEKISSCETIASICREVLKETENTYNNKRLYVIQHLLANCINQLNVLEKNSLTLNRFGIMALEMIPTTIQSSYLQLQYDPVLILEQLIMNMKMTIANKIVTMINKEHRLQPTNFVLTTLVKEFDELVTRYASLSLDLSTLRSAPNTPIHSPMHSPSHSPALHRKAFARSPHAHHTQHIWNPTTMTSSLYSDSPVLQDRVDQVKKEEQEFVFEKRTSSVSSTHHHGAAVGSVGGGGGGGIKEFVPPLKAVDKKEWVKDEQVSSCMCCHDLFNMFNRRHHCRHCGRVICATCSQIYIYIPRYQRKERTCIECYNYLHKPSSPNDETMKHGASRSSSPFSSLRSSLTRSPTKRVDSPSLLLGVSEQPEWILYADKINNKSIYEDFMFEQAPSASLCLALVDLYSNQNAAGGLLVTFCNNLSQYLQVRTKRDEIDTNMLAGMIEFVLNHAKLKFLKSGNNDGVSLCDTHLSRIEILKVLLEDNWQKIPTMQELTHPECLRRLRDRLIEDERFSLAMEITSKCALDPTPVHFVIGLSRLKCGNLEKAREQFARCLTGIRGESMKTHGPNTHYLQTIIETIESNPMIAINQIMTPQGSTSHVKSFLEHYKNSSGEYSLDKKRYDEVIYYLKTYGSHLQFVQFFMRNNMIKKAIQYIREKKCSHDVFVNHLLQPCFRDGLFILLCDEIRQNDPALKFWEAYLNEGCVYLSKHSSYHCLYQLQLFIKDYFRAALTCVRFYLGTASTLASSYKELSRRLNYLSQAREHLELLVKERSGRSSFVSHVGSSFLGDDKTLANQDVSTSELKRHLGTVNLQVDVTKFMSANEHMIKIEGKMPTLFGNGKERAELGIKILMITNDDALPLTSRIIQEFKLPSHIIFGRALKRIAHAQKYAEVLSILQTIEQNGMIGLKERDEILVQIVKVVAQVGQVKDANQFIRRIKDDISKINALILCGRLRDAYLEAVKNERTTEIQRILDEARRRPNQQKMVEICEKWLRKYTDVQSRKQTAIASSSSALT